jgi:sugar lactone lactonase YvrE
MTPAARRAGWKTALTAGALLVTSIVFCGGGVAIGSDRASSRRHLDIRLFARVPSPGFPANAAVAPDGKVYVATYSNPRPDTTPSSLFAFSHAGALLRRYVIHGQQVSQTHGGSAAAVDAQGIVYVLDQAPPRVLALDPRTGSQRVYARLHDVPPCATTTDKTDCSATTTDAASSPDFAAFAPDGALYITDFQQGLIWKVKRGGGDARVWYTSPLLDGGFITGPAGIQFKADGRTLVFSVFSNLGAAQATNPTTGKLYAVTIGAHGQPGALRKLWESRPGDFPDGFALARSGHIYIALTGANQLVEVAEDGTEVARVPATPAENALMPIPFDEPGGVTFDGDRLLVTNISYLAANPSSWAVYDVFAGEPGVPLFRPSFSR